MTTTAWEDNSWTALPHLAGVARSDVCVIGLGGSGLSAIHTLLDHGATVTGIDAEQIAGGAAGANGGFLLAGTARFYHQTIETLGRERARELYRVTVQEIERMQQAMPDIVRLVGSLRIAMSDDELADCETQFAMMIADNLPVERYNGPQGKGLLIPTDGVFNPLARCRHLAHAALKRGARLCEHTPALAINGGLVQTPLGQVRCKHVIVAVDGKLDVILPELNHRVRTARLQMLGTAPTQEVNIGRAVYARWGWEYWQQLPDGRVLLGGFRDQGGEGEWNHATEPSEVVQEHMTRFLRDHIKVQAPITHRWAASASFTDNGLPVVAEVRPNVWAIGGYNGTGNIVGALCGQAVATVISGAKSPLFAMLTQ